MGDSGDGFGSAEAAEYFAVEGAHGAMAMMQAHRGDTKDGGGSGGDFAGSSVFDPASGDDVVGTKTEMRCEMFFRRESGEIEALFGEDGEGRHIIYPFNQGEVHSGQSDQPGALVEVHLVFPAVGWGGFIIRVQRSHWNPKHTGGLDGHCRDAV